MNDSHMSLIRVSPTIESKSGEIQKPVVDLYWDNETKQIEVSYKGPVSDAAKLFMDEFADQLHVFFKSDLHKGEV